MIFEGDGLARIVREMAQASFTGATISDRSFMAETAMRVRSLTGQSIRSDSAVVSQFEISALIEDARSVWLRFNQC